MKRMWEHKWEILLAIGGTYKFYIEHEKTIKRHICELLVLVRIRPVSCLEQFQNGDKGESGKLSSSVKKRKSSPRKKDSEVGGGVDSLDS